MRGPRGAPRAPASAPRLRAPRRVARSTLRRTALSWIRLNYYRVRASPAHAPPPGPAGVRPVHPLRASSGPPAPQTGISVSHQASPSRVRHSVRVQRGEQGVALGSQWHHLRGRQLGHAEAQLLDRGERGMQRPVGRTALGVGVEQRRLVRVRVRVRIRVKGRVRVRVRVRVSAGLGLGLGVGPGCWR